MKEIKISEPLYAAEISYFINGTIPEFNKIMKKRFGKHYQNQADDTDAFQFSICPPGGEGELFYVFIAEPDLNLLWHETMHLAFAILRDRGITYGYKCEDVFAYLGGSIFEKLFKEGLQMSELMV